MNHLAIGIMNVRMSDIAHVAGVSHGTVFAHFKTQESLIEEVVETYCKKIAVRTHALAVLSESPPGVRDSWVTIQSDVSFHFSLVYEREYGHKACGRSLVYVVQHVDGASALLP